MVFRNFKIAALAAAGVLFAVVPLSAASAKPNTAPSARHRSNRSAQEQAAPSPSPSLQALPASITFDVTPQGSIASQTIQLTNTSPLLVTIQDVDTLGAGMEASAGALPVALDPGQTLLLRVAFTPKSASTGLGAVLVSDNRDASPILVELHAPSVESAAALTADQAAIDFPKTISGETGSRELLITNHAETSLRLVRAETHGAAFTVSGLSETQLAPGQTFDLRVAFHPSGPGSSTGDLSIFTSGAAAPLRIPLSGTGLAPSDHSTVVRWDADPNASNGYFVYRGTEPGGPYEKVNPAPTAETEYADSGLGAGQTYYYVITSVGSSNDESPYSNEVIVTVP